MYCSPLQRVKGRAPLSGRLRGGSTPQSGVQRNRMGFSSYMVGLFVNF